MASDTLTYTDSMNLKVRELLKEVQLEYSPETTATVDKVVSAIKEAIDKIPEDQVTADLAPGFVRDIKADKVEFTFKKPKSLEISGSYSIQCVTKPDLNVDLFLHLPKECFYEKDYLNYRYHAKRFLYLCKIKEQLKESPLIRAVRWSSFQNEARKPILLIYPAVKLIGNAEFVVRIIPTATSLLSATKLRLERNNIRTVKQGDALQATPRYNNSILEDLFLEDNAEFVKRTFSGWKELGEALILLKVWARQRSSIYAHDCLNGFLISVLLAFLATRPGRHHINEIDVLQKLARHDLGGKRCVQIRNWFDYRNHICIVFEKLGPSLYDFLRKNSYRSFPIDLVREFGRQLLESVAFMHDLRLIHTDLKPENILLVSSEYLKVPDYKFLLRPAKDGSYFKNVPKSSAIKLIDFGSTTFEHQDHTYVVSTRHYRAPEVILGLGWNYPCDMWSIGCILVELCSPPC